VEDTGIGIKKEDQKKIFESFEQVYSESSRKYTGTGLGLSIGLRLLELMNSKLEVESEAGKGSRFFFSIRFELASYKPESVLTKAENTTVAGKRVLLAEDNLINMMIAKKLLAGWEIETTPAINGLEALSALEKNADFDLILLDLGMPEMDGYEAIVEIKKHYPGIPVLAFTAALMDNEMHNSLLELGFADSILKPFKPDELLTKIREYAL
jgi:CheY-like chemotaxis protein